MLKKILHWVSIIVVIALLLAAAYVLFSFALYAAGRNPY